MVNHLHLGEFVVASLFDFAGGHEEILLELQTHHFVLFAAVAERAHHLTEEATAFQVAAFH